MGGRADKRVHHASGRDFGRKVLRKRASQIVGRQRTRESLLIEHPRLDITSVDIDPDEVVKALLGKRHLEHTGIVSRAVADKEVPAAQVAVISPCEIDNPPDIPLVRFHGGLLVFSTRMAR